MFSCVHLSIFLSGVVLALIALILSNISTRSMRRSLMEAEKRNRLLLGHTNATIYIIKPDGTFTYVSPNWSRVYDIPAKKAVGLNFKTVVIPEDAPVFATSLEKAVQSGQPQSGIEYRVRHAGGAIHWHTSSITPAYHKKSRSMIYVGVAHDINELKQAQEKLCLANDNLNSLLASRETELRTAVRAALNAADIEARRIGLEIHDNLCQELVGLLRMVENLNITEKMDACCARQTPVLRQQVAHTLDLARGVFHTI